MTREVARAIAATVALGSLLVTGCSGGTSDDAAASTKTSRSSPSASAEPTTTAPKTRVSTTPGVPTPGSTEKPATSSGPLSRRSFPTPRALGGGWRYAVDPGDAEEGYSGNGTPSLARDPSEVARTAVPLGCARSAALPMPSHALEVDYTLRTLPVIAVRARFADDAQARTFFEHRTTNLRACQGRVASAAIGPVVSDLRSVSSYAVSSRRTPRSDPWQEVAVLDGRTVALVAARGRLDPQQTTRLAALLRTTAG